MKKLKLHIRLLLMLISLLALSCQDENENFQPQEQQIDNFVSQELARQISNNVIFKNKELKNNNLLGKSSSIKKVDNVFPVIDENEKIIFYIINYQKGGFIILSADKRSIPILAFSESESFDISSDSYPSGLVQWLDMTKEGIKYFRTNNVKQSKEIEEEWETFNQPRIIDQEESDVQTRMVDPDDPNVCEDEFEQVGPLLTTIWAQGCGYNDYMPTLDCNEYPCYYNNRASAGCVPIAIAQVMKFYNYPTSYNWENMPDNNGTITTASLIYDIHNSISGISYKCKSTGVDHDYNVASVFTNHFNYSTASNSGYNTETLKQQLRWNRPVILSGGTDDGWWIFHNYDDGHMWVCDGFRRIFNWSEDCTIGWGYLYLHMNWGWGGYENGWYAFNNFNPDNYTFNYGVKMVYNIKP